MKIVVDFENKYPPMMEKVIGGASIPIKRKGGRKVKGGDRAAMIESAVEAADGDALSAEASPAEITSRQLFKHLYQCCSILHGPINQDEYKSYVIPILFFKRISDVYDEEYADALAYSDGDEEYASAEDMHSFMIPEGCHWNDVRKVSQNVGRAITAAMAGIEKANPETLADVFSSFDDATWTDTSKLTDERLKNLIEHMSLLTVGNKNYSADVMGDAYEYLIRQFADDSKKNAGEFYTPRPVVRLMVRLLDPKPGDSVYDPACGTGGMLIEAIHHMHNDRLSYGRIFGQESNMSTSAIARMNLYLHGAKDVQIMHGDTLRSPKFLEKRKLKTFTCVLANPPFGKDKWGAAQFESDAFGRNFWGSPSDSNADFAWLQHMVKSMDPEKGRCAVVLPQGVLFHSGKEGKMREKLIRSDKLEAVIALASGVFYSTGVSACILFLNNKKQHKHKGRICLIDGGEVFTAMRAQNILSEENVSTLYGYYQDYQDVIERVKVISISDAEQGGFELLPKKYIEHKKQEITPPHIVRRNYMAALEAVKAAEGKVNRLLIEGGYVHER